jgi:hypothetical protein
VCSFRLAESLAEKKSKRVSFEKKRQKLLFPAGFGESKAEARRGKSHKNLLFVFSAAIMSCLALVRGDEEI